MSETVTRADFVQAFRARAGVRGAGVVELENLSQEDWQRLAGVGVRREEVTAVAGGDHRIAGDREADRLFSLLDRLDRDGSRDSLVRRRPDTAGLREPTRAGSAHDLLLGARRAARQAQRAQFVEAFGAGYFDLRLLVAAQESALCALGASVEELRGLADDQGRIRGQHALRALFAWLDDLDRDGSSATFERSVPLALETTPTPAQLTPAGRAERLLEGLFRCYEQPYTEYSDLSRARIVPEPRPGAVTLGLEQITQWDSTSCYRACRRMIERFNFAVDRQIADGQRSHYMARAENRRGWLTGAAEDFARGLAYVDHCLAVGRPVMVGLSHADRSYNFDAITDHFVVIKGRGVDDDDRLYYLFADPATSGENRESRFYVDDHSSMLFRPPTHHPARIVAQRAYQVSAVVTYRDPGFTFESITGAPVTSYR